MQAAACGLAPDLRFNPVLLKPGSDLASQVVLLGEAVDTVTAGNFRALRPRLAETAYAALAELRAEYDVVICEGAGSPAEINLRAGDYVNMGLARHAGLPTIVVGDIDRGGVFASMFGTVALLDPADQALVAGFVINKFRGDLGLLRPGLDMLRQVTGRPTYGVLPWALDLWLDAEDSLAYGRVLGRPAAPRGTEWLRRGRGPAAPDQQRHRRRGARHRAGCPGTAHRRAGRAGRRRPGRPARLQVHRRRPGLAARDRPRRRGRRRTPRPASRCSASAAASRCSAGPSTTRWRAAGAACPGSACCPSRSPSTRARPSGRPVGTAAGDLPVRGYEIHHGYVSAADPALPPLLHHADGAGEGARARRGARHPLARRVRVRRVPPPVPHRGRPAGRAAPASASRRTPRFAAARERALDLLGDLVEEHLDTDALWRLIETGAPAGLPFVPPGAPPTSLTAAAASVGSWCLTYPIGTAPPPQLHDRRRSVGRGSVGSGQGRMSAGWSDSGQPGLRQRLHAADHVGGVAQAERLQAGGGQAGAVALPAHHARSPGRSRSPPGCARRWPGRAATPAPSGR